MSKLRKDWRSYLINESEAENMDNAYIVFEEDEEGTKNYDLCKGIFTDLEVAKEYAEAMNGKEKNYVANYKDYMDGNYDYL